jgi:hypothetical protein
MVISDSVQELGTQTQDTRILPGIFRYLPGISDSVSYPYSGVQYLGSTRIRPGEKIPIFVSENMSRFDTRIRYLSRVLVLFSSLCPTAQFSIFCPILLQIFLTIFEGVSMT